jgi:hypothetical protein
MNQAEYKEYLKLLKQQKDERRKRVLNKMDMVSRRNVIANDVLEKSGGRIADLLF